MLFYIVQVEIGAYLYLDKRVYRPVYLLSRVNLNFTYDLSKEGSRTQLKYFLIYAEKKMF